MPVAQLVSRLDRIGVVQTRRTGLADHDRVFESVAVPRDEGRQQVPTAPERRILWLVPRLHKRGLGIRRNHTLAHHVSAHQRAIGVAVLQEGDHRRGQAQARLGSIVCHDQAPVADLGTQGNGEYLAHVGPLGGLDRTGPTDMALGEHTLPIGDLEPPREVVACKPVHTIHRMVQLQLASCLDHEGLQPCRQGQPRPSQCIVPHQLGRGLTKAFLNEVVGLLTDTADRRSLEIVPIGHRGHDPRPPVDLEDSRIIRLRHPLEDQVHRTGLGRKRDLHTTRVFGSGLNAVANQGQPIGEKFGQSILQESLVGSLVPRCSGIYGHQESSLPFSMRSHFLAMAFRPW